MEVKVVVNATPLQSPVTWMAIISVIIFTISIKTTLKKLDENNQSGEASMMEINENVEILSEGSFVQAANYLFGENNEYEEKYLRSFLKIDDKIDL